MLWTAAFDAEVDDAAGFLSDQMLAENLAGQHQSLQIHGQDAVNFLFGNVQERRR